MKIALIGYGKMGAAIEQIAHSRGHEVIYRFTSKEQPTATLLKQADIAIEFTRPEAAREHILMCMEAGCPIVVGTTGWYENFIEVEQACLKSDGSLLYGTNFSLGVNIAFFVNEILAKIMSHYPEYRAEITEIHHTRKLDAPSGTAISLADGLISNHSIYTNWKLSSEAGDSKILPIHALREGDVPGTHVVSYESEIDTLALKHEAHNRKGFALGSVLAAEWLLDKKGVYSMRDMLNFGALI